MATSLNVFSGSGEVRALLRESDWTGFQLGHPDIWPALMKTTIGMVLDSSLPMYVAWGPNLHLFYNDAYAQVLGSKHSQALTHPLWQVWSEVEQEFRELVDSALSGTPAFFENSEMQLHRHGRDETTWFTFSITPIRDEHGEIPGIWVTVVETTKQVLTEQRRVAELDRLQHLFQEAPGFMAIVHGPDHVYELVNKAYLQAAGGRELLHKPVREALPELAGQGYYELLDRVYSTGEPYVARGLPVRLQRQAGSELEELVIDFVYQPIFEADGKVSGIFIEGSDVTVQYRAQQELEHKIQELSEADRRKDEYLAMLAHELRNPLAPISAAADLMDLLPFDETRLKQTSQVISRQVRHMTGLVDDLLDVSRVRSGLVTIDMVPQNLKSIVSSAVEQVQPVMESQRHHLGIKLLPESVYVPGDDKRLVQILTNLLNNAAKYTPSGGKIELRVDADTDCVLIHISDNGIGIEPDMQDRVFDLFTQAKRTPDRTQGGLGLGLTLVRSLVELHGGTVSCTSAGIGKGSCFTIRLPRIKEQLSMAKCRPGDGLLANSTKKLRILVVDDNVDAAVMLQMLLEAVGHEVFVVHTAQQALDYAQTRATDVALLDIGLPDIDGHELARKFGAWPAMASTTLVALTGYGQDHDQKIAKEAGFSHHFVKPVDTQRLVSLLTEIADS